MNDKSETSLNEKKEKFAILNAFVNVAKANFIKADSTDGRESIQRIDDLYKLPAFTAEKKRLTEISNNGMLYGLALGFGTFAFLRAGPRLLQRFLQRRQYTSSGGYKFSKVTNTHPTAGMSNPPSQQGFFLRTIKLTLDFFVSSSIAMFGSVYFVDRKKLMSEVADIPLVEGRSMISELLCNDFIDLYRSIPKNNWDKYHGNSDSLDIISTFVTNCLKRQFCEEQILQQRQGFGDLNTSNHDGIPPPGVAVDTPICIEWINPEGKELHDSTNAQDFGEYKGNSSSDFPKGDQVPEMQYEDSEFEENPPENNPTKCNDNEKRWI